VIGADHDACSIEMTVRDRSVLIAISKREHGVDSGVAERVHRDLEAALVISLPSR